MEDQFNPQNTGSRNEELGTGNFSGSKGSTSTKRQPKGKTKTTTDAAVTGSSGLQRFQCPKCPKTFSRIENLTRHQANHEDVAKFVCIICRKRFTRSDLLNRHRRIHVPQAESSKPHAVHVTQVEYPGVNQYDTRYDSLAREDRSSMSQEEPSGITNPASDIPFQHIAQHQPQGFYPDPNQNPAQVEYQNIMSQNQFPNISQLRPQGLTSLVEAALAPQQQFTLVDNINPALWDGFMLFGDKTSSYMGTYDADISWALSSFQTEPSPSFSSDYEMMNQFDDFPENAYQPYPSLQYPHRIINPTDDADAEDEDTNDWPDKVSRPSTPIRRTNRIVPLQFLPISWQPVLDEARASGLSANTMRPMQNINDALRQSLLAALNGVNFRHEISRPVISDAMFPPSEALDYFLRLYIQYVQPRFPVLHLPTFDMYNSPSLLLIAMMFLGSSHSSSDRGRFSRLFHEHLKLACIRMQEVDSKYLRSVDNILSYFLLCLAGTWSGSKQSYEFAEGGRGVLVTACRRARLLDCRPSANINVAQSQRPGLSTYDPIWLAWIETEKRKRLGLSIYIFDCQYPALFNNQPYVSKAETTNCVFPCPEEYWEAPTAESWKMIVGPADMPPSVYHLHALNSCLLRKWVTPPPPIVKAGGFGKLVVIYALLTHIFEWRQATSMVNPTGLTGTFGDAAYGMGKGLRERRKWLLDSLDSWGECYGGSTAAASLLHRLAYISLDVSLSDMHLVAGRSNNIDDGKFAEENLKHWANSDIANGTMSHTYAMLEICHHCVATGTAADNSYEVAVCLFTGGIVCWAYAKLRVGGGREREVCMDRVRGAGRALREMGCWRMGGVFGRILGGWSCE